MALLEEGFSSMHKSLVWSALPHKSRRGGTSAVLPLGGETQVSERRGGMFLMPYTYIPNTWEDPLNLLKFKLGLRDTIQQDPISKIKNRQPNKKTSGQRLSTFLFGSVFLIMMKNVQEHLLLLLTDPSQLCWYVGMHTDNWISKTVHHWAMIPSDCFRNRETGQRRISVVEYLCGLRGFQVPSLVVRAINRNQFRAVELEVIPTQSRKTHPRATLLRDGTWGVVALSDCLFQQDSVNRVECVSTLEPQHREMICPGL